MRFQLALLLTLAFSSLCNAQIKIDGPKEATTGYRVKAKLTLDVTDAQIKCFPANDDWYAVQDLSGAKFIDFVPGRKAVPVGQKSQLFTFVVAGHKAGKTYLETYEVTVVPDTPPEPPKPPEPEPEKTQLYKDLLAAYKVSPSGTALKLHIKLYAEFLSECKADKYNSASVAGAALKTKFGNVSELQGVQDVVAEYLQKNAGQTWNKAKTIAALEVVVATLRTVPE